MKKNNNENERIDDLEFKGYKIIQKKDGFCFGIDAVLLSDFAKEIKEKSKIIDLGSGTGIISILLAGKTIGTEIYGIEIQKEMAEMARRSVSLNKLDKRIKMINEDINNLDKIFEVGFFDSVVTNPPYKKKNTGKINDNKNKFISRHETTADLARFIEISFKLLKDKGPLYMVHRPERLADIIFELRKYKMEPKVIRFVHSGIDREPKLVLIKAVKNANKFLKIEKPLYVYNEDGTYTEEILKIYNKK